MPIYSDINSLDNCNFSNETAWEGHISSGNTFEYYPGKTPGKQYISEATDLQNVPTGAYEFLLSSHALEHLANPLRGLKEWVRCIKADGHLILLVPHFKATFDHRRPVTTLAHLLDDFSKGTAEDDLTHLEEILALHDFTRDPGAGSYEEFELRSRSNLENRCLHQHVFNNKLVIDLMSHVNLQILSFENIGPNHILLIAQSLSSGLADNDKFTAENCAPTSWDSSS